MERTYLDNAESIPFANRTFEGKRQLRRDERFKHSSAMP